MHRVRHGSRTLRLSTLSATLMSCAIATVLVTLAFALFSRPSLQSGERHLNGALNRAHKAAVLDGAPPRVFRSKDTVQPHAPYQPVYAKWAQQVYPSAARTPAPGSPGEVSCVAWRQTGGCSPDGPREAFLDRRCDATIFTGPSGFCDCGNGVRKGLTTCESHPPFTCDDVCSEEDGAWKRGRRGRRWKSPPFGDSSDSHADADHQIDSVVIVGQRTYPSDQFLIARAQHLERTAARRSSAIRRVFSAYSELRAQRAGGETTSSGTKPAWRSAVEVVRSIRALDTSRILSSPADATAANASDPAAMCVMWRQTAGYTPFGKPEPSLDRPCTALISDGMSGYCECAAGRRAQGVSCVHKPFTCLQLCDPKSAFDAARDGDARVGRAGAEHTIAELYYRPLSVDESAASADGLRFNQQHLEDVATLRRASGHAAAAAVAAAVQSRGAARLVSEVLDSAQVAALDAYIQHMVEHNVREPPPVTAAPPRKARRDEQRRPKRSLLEAHALLSLSANSSSLALQLSSPSILLPHLDA